MARNVNRACVVTEEAVCYRSNNTAESTFGSSKGSAVKAPVAWPRLFHRGRNSYIHPVCVSELVARDFIYTGPQIILSIEEFCLLEYNAV
jgi:hypothetical protein